MSRDPVLEESLAIAREVAADTKDVAARMTINALVVWIEGVTGLDGTGRGII